MSAKPVNLEIEARFLVTKDTWRDKGKPTEIAQGYLSTEDQRVVRIRVEGDRAALTLKGKSSGLQQEEFEFPLDDAAKARKVIEKFSVAPPILKTRHVVKENGFRWEIDEFHGRNEGLVIAEAELANVADRARLEKSKPAWLGRDITNDFKYRNNRLAERPFLDWAPEEQKEALARRR
jgi:adenylate cyclase